MYLQMPVTILNYVFLMLLSIAALMQMEMEFVLLKIVMTMMRVYPLPQVLHVMMEILEQKTM